jgi:hypothetical protein
MATGQQPNALGGQANIQNSFVGYADPTEYTAGIKAEERRNLESTMLSYKINRRYTYPLNNQDDYQGRLTFQLVDEESERAVNLNLSGSWEASKSAVKNLAGFAADVITGSDDNAKINSLYGYGQNNTKPTSIKKEPSLLRNNKITLYLPQAIQIQDAASYDTNIELGRLGGSIERSLLSENSVANAITASTNATIEGMKSLISAGDLSVLSREQAAVAAQKVSSLASSLPGVPNTSSALKSVPGVTVNPNVRALFKSVPIRNFSFSFELIPTSAQEAEEIRNIIKFFRTELYPEQFDIAGVSYGYKFPSRFVIKASYRNKEIPGIKFLPVYLQSFNAVYNPNGQGMHADGHFGAVNISMSFTEGAALNKQDVAVGGY